MERQVQQHGHGLAQDLEKIARGMVARRRALALLAGAGTTAALAACGGGDDVSSTSSSTDSSSTTTTSSSSGGSTSSTSSSPTSTSSGTSTASCIADPTETNGPYPACYSGRWPHIHFEVFTGGLTVASTGRTASLISQLAMPAATSVAVFNGDTRYTASIANYNAISLSSDNVFGDNTSAQLGQMTPTLSGTVSTGYTGTALIGIAA